MDADVFFLRFESQRSTPPQMHNSWLKMAEVFESGQASNAPQTHLKRTSTQLKRTSNTPQTQLISTLTCDQHRITSSSNYMLVLESICVAYVDCFGNDFTPLLVLVENGRSFHVGASLKRNSNGPQTHLNAPQTHLKRTSDAPRTHLKHTSTAISFAGQRTTQNSTTQDGTGQDTR